jgi:hypothetical protein
MAKDKKIFWFDLETTDEIAKLHIKKEQPING